jgi:hypothetical protein
MKRTPLNSETMPKRPHLLVLLLGLVSFACQAGGVSLCTAQEESIFWCNSRTKRYELCASTDLGAATGYMQYRAGSKGRADFAYPAQKRGPRGVFELELLAKGTRLWFENGPVLYEIYQPLAGGASIAVTARGQSPVTAVRCVSDSDTLNLTSTMQRFETLGIYK